MRKASRRVMGKGWGFPERDDVRTFSTTVPSAPSRSWREHCPLGFSLRYGVNPATTLGCLPFQGRRSAASRARLEMEGGRAPKTVA